MQIGFAERSGFAARNAKVTNFTELFSTALVFGTSLSEGCCGNACGPGACHTAAAASSARTEGFGTAGAAADESGMIKSCILLYILYTYICIYDYII